MTIGKTILFLASLLAGASWAGADSAAEKKSDVPILMLSDFDGQKVADGWKTVNDNVMGGRSKGGPSFKDGILTFTGATNTNGGGFSSIRTKPGKFDLRSCQSNINGAHDLRQEGRSLLTPSRLNEGRDKGLKSSPKSIS